MITDGFQWEDTHLPTLLAQVTASDHQVRPLAGEIRSSSLMEFIAALTTPLSDSALKSNISVSEQDPEQHSDSIAFIAEVVQQKTVYYIKKKKGCCGLFCQSGPIEQNFPVDTHGIDRAN